MKLLTIFCILSLVSVMAIPIFHDFCPQIIDQDDDDNVMIENYRQVFDRIALFELTNNITSASIETFFLPQDIAINGATHVPIIFEDIVGFSGTHHGSTTERETYFHCFRYWYDSEDLDELDGQPMALPDGEIIIDSSSVIYPFISVVLATIISFC